MILDATGAFLIVVTNIVFWFLTLFKRDVSDHARAYFWWSLFITLWALGYGLTLGAFYSYEATLTWNRFCQAMALMIGPFFLRLCSYVIHQSERYHRTFLIYLLISIPNALALFFTPWYVKGL